MKNLQIHITGKVHKVGFRYFVKQMAERLEISGSVKYSPDHSILINASGNDKSLDKFISFCRLGCIGSDVKNISLSEAIFPQNQSFEIINETQEISGNKNIKNL